MAENSRLFMIITGLRLDRANVLKGVETVAQIKDTMALMFGDVDLMDAQPATLQHCLRPNT